MFSTGGRVLDPYRTRLFTKIVKTLICTQDWVKKSSNPIFEDDINNILNDGDITNGKTLILILMFVATINIFVK